mmetsp:Transcript_13631/g.54647  ORF Transcript_13631/g.54647 Transcript_13631/m.54647 type:complete len:249 (-) Transcript_13631:115-861(-)
MKGVVVIFKDCTELEDLFEAHANAVNSMVFHQRLGQSFLIEDVALAGLYYHDDPHGLIFFPLPRCDEFVVRECHRRSELREEPVLRKLNLSVRQVGRKLVQRRGACGHGSKRSCYGVQLNLSQQRSLILGYKVIEATYPELERGHLTISVLYHRAFEDIHQPAGKFIYLDNFGKRIEQELVISRYLRNQPIEDRSELTSVLIDIPVYGRREKRKGGMHNRVPTHLRLLPTLSIILNTAGLRSSHHDSM